MARKKLLGIQKRKNLQKFITSLQKEGTPITKVILFGSYAKGTQHKWSDIDLAIFSPRFGQDYNDELVTLFKKAKNFDLSFEPHPFHPDDLNDKYDSLITEIKKYGQEIKI